MGLRLTLDGVVPQLLIDLGNRLGESLKLGFVEYPSLSDALRHVVHVSQLLRLWTVNRSLVTNPQPEKEKIRSVPVVQTLHN